MKTFTGEFGGIDVLVNNAGIGSWGALAEVERADFERVMAVNVLGTLFMTQAALPPLPEPEGRERGQHLLHRGNPRVRGSGTWPRNSRCGE